MMETYKLVLILIIYTAVLLLVIFYVYPQLKKLFSHKVSISIRIGKEEMTGEAEKKEVVKAPKQEKFPSILGETKFVLSQPLPNTATDLETENRKEKDNTFASGTEKPEDEKPDKTVNLETGEGVEPEEENEDEGSVNSDEETEDLGVGNMPEEKASGIDYRELGVATKTISDSKNSSPTDEKMTGKILSENKNTDLVQFIQKAHPAYSQRIGDLIDKFEKEHLASVAVEEKVSPRTQKMYESEEFRNFNPKDIS